MSATLTPARQELKKLARKLAESEIAPRAGEIDRSEEYPWENVKALTRAGFMGMTVPEEYGGLGLAYLDVVLVIEEMAKVCGVTGRIVVEAKLCAAGRGVEYSPVVADLAEGISGLPQR